MNPQEAMAIVRVTPQDPDAWVSLGNALALAEEPEKARESYQRALALAPQHPEAMAGIARLDLPPWLRGEPLQAPRPVDAPATHGRAIFRKELAKRTSEGWLIVSQTDDSAQFRRPKRSNPFGTLILMLLLVGGCAYPPLLGVALVWFLIWAGDYLMRQDEVEFITAAQMLQEDTSADFVPLFSRRGLLVVGAIAAIVLGGAAVMLAIQ